MRFRDRIGAGAVACALLLLSGCQNRIESPVKAPPWGNPGAASTPPAVAAPAAGSAGARVPLAQKMVEFHDTGQWLQAIGAANRVIRNGGPSVAKAYYIRGSAEGQMNEFGLAVQDLKTATEKAPHDEMAWFSRAWYEYELGQVDQAIATGEKAVALNPRLAMGWLNLGLCYAVRNNVAKARRCYDAGRKLSNRGVLAAAMRDIDDALERYPGSRATLDQAMKWLTGE